MKQTEFKKNLYDCLEPQESTVQGNISILEEGIPSPGKGSSTKSTSPLYPGKAIANVPKIPSSTTKRGIVSIAQIKRLFSSHTEGLLCRETEHYFDWLVILAFLVIMVSGIYYIKPPSPQKSAFSSPPFEFTKIYKKGVNRRTDTLSTPIFHELSNALAEQTTTPKMQTDK